jgi:hypothetical protein
MTRRALAAALAIAAMTAAISAPRLCADEMSVYRTFTSPDGAFSVVVLRKPQALSLPGQSADAPGLVALRDATGRTIAEKPVDIISVVDEVTWSQHSVHVKFVDDWRLPELR